MRRDRSRRSGGGRSVHAIRRALAIACATVALTLVGAADARAPFRPLGVWGGPGAAPGQFNTPNGIAVDDMGHVYVADELNHRIQKFSSHGRLLGVLGGTPGVGNGQFNAPYGVAVDGFGDVYVADTRNNRIQKLSPTGRFLARWGRNGGDGSSGTGSGEFSSPRGVAVDDLGHVYVADHDNNRVVKLSPTGRVMAIWGRNGGDGTAGSARGEFNLPRGVAVDHSGHVFVAEKANNRIQEFTSEGTFIRRWGAHGGDGTAGSGNGEFRVPYTIAIDGAGDMYVTDVLNHRIQKFGPTGRFIARYGHNGGDGTPGTALGEFEEPYGVRDRLPLERLRHRGGHGSRPEARRRRTPGAALSARGRRDAAGRASRRRPGRAPRHGRLRPAVLGHRDRRDHRRLGARPARAAGSTAGPCCGAGRPRSGSRCAAAMPRRSPGRCGQGAVSARA